MSTHESWQFSFVREIGAGVKPFTRLGYKKHFKVEPSNLVVGTVPDDLFPTEIVTGDHIRVYYTLPKDENGFTLTGKIKVLRKTKEFPRDYQDTTAVLVVDEDLSANLGLVERDTYFLHLDHLTSNQHQTWYYTVFYEGTDVNTNTLWCFSPLASHDRTFGLDSGESSMGVSLFDYMPRGVKILDARNGDALFNLLQTFGKSLDEVNQRTKKFQDESYKVESVDASFIPYIDHLLGWPTNFELREVRRRKETSNAIDIWRSKGTNDAFELSLQTLTGWDVEIYLGFNYILYTATEEDAIQAGNPPAGWVEATDGVWADIVNSVPFNGTVDLSDPNSVRIEGLPTDNYRVMMSLTGEDWRSLFGVLILLTTPLGSGQPLLNNLAIEKIHRLLPYLGIHYADFSLQALENFTESLVLNISDDYADSPLRASDDLGSLDILESLSDTSNIPLLYTYPHIDPNQDPVNVTWSSGLGSPAGRTFHTAFA
jgi:hypothetical protein